MLGLWQNFAQTTGIKGFSFLNQAKSRAEQLFWGLAVFACFGETIVDVYETIRLYRSGPIATGLKVQRSDNLNVSPIIFCQYIAINSTPPGNRELSNIFSTFAYTNVTELYDNQARQLTTTGKASEEFLSLLSATFSLVYSLKKIESDESEFDANVTSRIFALETFYRSKGVDIGELLHMIGRVFWCSHNYSAISFNNDKVSLPVENCVTAKLTGVGKSTERDAIQFCLEAPKASFSTMYDNITIYGYRSESPMLVENSYFLLGFETYLSVKSENFVDADVTRDLYLNVQLQGVYKSKNTTSSPCLSDPNADCYLECKMNKFTQLFGCRFSSAAFLQEFGDGDTTFCTIEDYKNISVKTAEMLMAIESVKSTCRSECLKPCERKIYSFTKDLINICNNSPKPQINIFVSSFVYPQFEEFEGMSTKQFLAQLGGNLSLWLGASFLVLIHLSWFLLKSVDFLIFGKRRNLQEDKTDTDAANQLRHLLGQPICREFVEEIVKNSVLKLELDRLSETTSDTQTAIV